MTNVVFIGRILHADAAAAHGGFKANKSSRFPKYYFIDLRRARGEEDTAADSLIGVRQGTREGIILFLVIVQAALEILEWPVAKPTFRTCADGVTSGERINRKRGVPSSSRREKTW